MPFALSALNMGTIDASNDMLKEILSSFNVQTKLKLAQLHPIGLAVDLIRSASYPNGSGSEPNGSPSTQLARLQLFRWNVDLISSTNLVIPLYSYSLLLFCINCLFYNVEELTISHLNKRYLKLGGKKFRHMFECP